MLDEPVCGPGCHLHPLQYTITLTAVTPGGRIFTAKNSLKIRTPGIGCGLRPGAAISWPRLAAISGLCATAAVIVLVSRQGFSACLQLQPPAHKCQLSHYGLQGCADP